MHSYVVHTPVCIQVPVHYTLCACPPMYICITRTQYQPYHYVQSVFISSSLNTVDVPHVTISVTTFPMSSLLLVGTVLNLVMSTVTALSDSRWVRGRDRVTEPFTWLMARDWTSSTVKSATCTPSTSTVYRSVG